MSTPPHEPTGSGSNRPYGISPSGGVPHHQTNITPLPNDLSRGWLPEDTRQTPGSPLPAPKLFGFQSLLPFKFLNRLRHPGEIPWLVAAYLVTLTVYVGVGIYMVTSVVGFFTGDLSNVEPVDPATADSPGALAQLAFLAVYLPLGIFWLRALQYAQMRLRGVRITPTQFPEAYAMVVEAAHAAGLRRVPDAYVVLGNGQINAFASGHGHRRFIAVYSDLFEVGGAVRSPEALRFIIGHEVGHIAAGHVGYFRLIFTSFFASIPYAGATLSRAQEYTADNFGYRLAPAGALEAMSVLAAGKYLHRDVNTDEFANRAVFEGGFFTWLANLNSSHPSPTWRMHSLRDRSEPGRLIWRPKINPAYPLSMAPAAEPAEVWADPVQAGDFMQAYPENPANQHWGDNVTEPKTRANSRDRRVGDTLYTGWVPPQLRGYGRTAPQAPGPQAPAPQNPAPRAPQPQNDTEQE